MSSSDAAILAVSFDVGGTLIEPWPSVGHIYADVAAEVGLRAPDPSWLNQQFAAAWQAKSSFDYSRSAWADLVVQTFGQPASEVGVDTVFFRRVYERFTQADCWHIYDDVLPALEALRTRGVRLAVVSNWDERLRPLLKNLRLDRFFCAIEVSGECGYHKPDRQLFLRAVRALGLRSDQVLHVGDSRREDLEGAQEAGLSSRWLRRGQPRGAPREIGSLAELLTELRRPG